MHWSAEGLIIGVRRHGESSVIAEVMVEGRGRTLGLVRGGRSSKLAATLQAGNLVQVTWRARLEDHLGTMTVELTGARAADLIADKTRLYARQFLCGAVRHIAQFLALLLHLLAQLVADIGAIVDHVRDGHHRDTGRLGHILHRHPVGLSSASGALGCDLVHPAWSLVLSPLMRDRVLHVDSEVDGAVPDPDAPFRAIRSGANPRQPIVNLRSGRLSCPIA